MTAFVWLSIVSAECGRDGYPTGIPWLQFEIILMASFVFKIEQFEQSLNQLEKEQLPFALMSTMNDLAFGMQRQITKEMDKYYDGGATRWSKSGIGVYKASKKRLYAAVFTRENREYLATTIFGGVVNPFPQMEYLVKPGAQKLNKYGNIPRGSLKRKAQNKSKYFVGKPKGSKRSQPHGLYQTYKRKAPKLIIDLSDKSRYQKGFFPAPKIAAKYFKQQHNKMFMKNFKRAMRTARPLSRPTGF